MWTYHPDLLAGPVPRYTSYPTAAEFVEESFEDRQREALKALRGTVSLYLHIPYCREICWYCGCNTGAANKTQRLAAYMEALHHEIDLVSRLLHLLMKQPRPKSKKLPTPPSNGNGNGNGHAATSA